MNRIELLMQQLPKHIDCALITSDVNRRYLTGMASSAGTVLCFRDAAYLLIDFRYIEKARACVKDCRVIELENLTVQVGNLLKQHDASTIAVESATMTLQQFENMKKRFSHTYRWESSDVLSKALQACRMVKTAEEIAQIQAAQRIAEQALQQVQDWIHIGVTEREVQRKLDFAMLELGAEEMSFATIALTGARTSMPHGVPSDAVVQAGDFVLMDFGAVVNGYHSDMTRTICVGEPTEKMRAVYEVVQKAQTAALQAAKAGVTGKELDAVARNIIADAGYGKQFGHSLGHGVGMEIHEAPNAAPSSDVVLQAGNVVTIEPGIYLPGEFGVRIEDFVVLQENGCQNLTAVSSDLICIK
jgi:Xaa-Pro aminopeptidase